MLELWLIVVGSLLHGVYGLTGSNIVIGLLVPVNESVWEHFKLGYTAMMLWHVMPVRWKRTDVGQQPLATVIGVVVLNVTVILVFLLIRPHFSHHAAVLTVDIGSYVLGSLVSGYMIRRWPTSWPPHRGLALLLWVVIGVIFAYATVWPPHYPLFIHGGMGN